MTAPLFHLRDVALDQLSPGGTVTLCGQEAHHAVNVMRLGLGETILISDGSHIRAEATVTEIRADELIATATRIQAEDAPTPSITLVQALAKDRRDLQAIESATELGVERVIPWQAERSIARWPAGREEKKHCEWQSMVTSAAKQTRRTSIPVIDTLHTTTQYLQKIRAQAATSSAQIKVLVLHESATITLVEALKNSGAQLPAELHLVVGPEGGIKPDEIDRFTQAGAAIVRLGPHILRTSTAGVAAMSAVEVLLGRWG